VTRWGEQSRNSGEMTNGERKVKRAGICVCSSKQEAASAGRTAVAGSRCRYRVVVVMEPSAGERDSRQRATVALAQLTAAPECSLASALLLRPLAPAWIATATGGWHSAPERETVDRGLLLLWPNRQQRLNARSLPHSSSGHWPRPGLPLLQVGGTHGKPSHSSATAPAALRSISPHGTHVYITWPASCRARGAAPSSMAAWHACVICISARACSRSIHSRAGPGRAG
jgi:hypothetical protein